MSAESADTQTMLFQLSVKTAGGEGETIFEDDYGSVFTWREYLVFASVLVASMAIGVFYGFFSRRNQTHEDFLLAGRSMSVLPVSLSLICSFVSAITILGTPVEVYFYGLVYSVFALTFIPMTLAVAYIYLPVFFSLQLTSAYEYFELRFNKTTRKIASGVSAVYLMIYMPLTVWGPSLALHQVAGVDKYWSSAVIFLVCVAYSSMGGMRAVLWSDALQASVMFGSLLTILFLGVGQVGGWGEVWERASLGGRTDVLNFQTDYRVRHSWWTGVVGSYFLWMPLFAGTQAQVQRYLSVPTLRQARVCLLVNMAGLFLIVGLCSFLGILVYANYAHCDPTSPSLKVVSSSDQILPLFVMDVLGDFHGIPGLFVAGLTSGSLSTVSSALNSLPAILVEDFVKPVRPNLTEIQLGRLSKVISAVCGLLSFSLIFVIASVGNVLPFATILIGIFIGPVVSLFTLGMLFPWANSLGSLVGCALSLVLTLFVGIGTVLANNAGNLPNQKLPLTIDGCFLNVTSVFGEGDALSEEGRSLWKEEEGVGGVHSVLSLSYQWQPIITIVGSVTLGLICSGLVSLWGKGEEPVKAEYLTPLAVSLWVRLLGKQRLSAVVSFPQEKRRRTSSSAGKADSIKL